VIRLVAEHSNHHQENRFVGLSPPSFETLTNALIGPLVEPGMAMAMFVMAI
jgi:hypothetical protein